jgi:hypothetical protein
MSNKPTTQWIIGAALFGGFLLSLWLDLTGLALHQWLGVAVGALAVYHLAAHWRWVVAVSQRFLGRTSRQARTFYVVDAGLAAGFAAIVVTGLAISTWFDLALASYTTWLTVHIVASLATLALVVLKIGLHWRWIVTTARKRILPAPAQPAKAAPVAVTAETARRDFLRLMAGVGALALLGGVNALGGLKEGQAEASVDAPDALQQATAPSTASRRTRGSASSAAGSSGSTSSTCQVQCNKRCSYPGHCRRYTDSNGNGRCDLGECLS